MNTIYVLDITTRTVKHTTFANGDTRKCEFVDVIKELPIIYSDFDTCRDAVEKRHKKAMELTKETNTTEYDDHRNEIRSYRETEIWVMRFDDYGGRYLFRDNCGHFCSADALTKLQFSYIKK